MRVKLSYTADAEEIFSETAFLLTSLGPSIQATVEEYNALLRELQGGSANLQQSHKHLSTIRQLLGKIDTRCAEVGDILLGYEEYNLRQRADRPELFDMPQTESLAHGEEEGD